MQAITILDEYDFLNGKLLKCPDNAVLKYITRISQLTLPEHKNIHWIIDINPNPFNKAKRYKDLLENTNCNRILLIHGITDIDIYLNIMQAIGSAEDAILPVAVLTEIRHKFEKYSKEEIAGLDFMRGRSAAIEDLYHLAELVAPTDYPVILYGETGTGKEIMSKYIHKLSHRRNKPFIAIDCGCINKDIGASELFGHVKGAFTDAVAEKAGAFEMANGGTLFLDEIGNLPYEVQALLLRSIQEQKIRKVGSEKEMSLDVRIIVASNENLLQLSQKGQFREDLYHRLNGLLLAIPPLRDRKEDLPLLTHYFLEKACAELNRELPRFTTDAWEKMLQYRWPGNIRELNNVLKQVCLLVPPDGSIDAALLPFESASKQVEPSFEEQPAAVPVLQQEYNVITEALKKAKYNKSKAAEILNIHRKTLYNKLRSLNIQV